MLGSDLRPDVRAEGAHEIRHQYLSAAKARRLLQWRPRYGLEEALGETIAVAMVEEEMISKEEAVMRVAPAHLDQLLHPVFDPKTLKDLTKLTTGISASPGAARTTPPCV